jgi:hypothetical protein
VSLLLTALALSAAQAEAGPWTRYQQGPQKLVVSWAQGGVIAIDYPTWDRCQRAREAVEQEASRRIEAARRSAPPGSTLVGSPWIVYAFCIPA